MEKERLAVVNELPLSTYRFLKVNASSLFVPKAAATYEDDWQGLELPAGISISKAACLADTDEAIRGTETGMGSSVDHELSEKNIPVSVLRIPAGTKAEQPVVLPVAVSCSAPSMAALAICAEEGSEVSVVLDIIQDAAGCAASRGFFGLSTRICAGKGAKVRLSHVIRLGSEITWFDDIGGRCEDDASIELSTLSLGEQKRSPQGCGFLGTKIDLKGDGSSFIDRTGYYCAGQTQLDMNYVVDQRGRDTSSDMTFNGILDDHAWKIWRGTIDFKSGSAGSVGDEQEDVLLLSPHVENDSVPVILCGEEDVDGRHGATIGQLSDEILFYMSSRGYAEAEARRLIVQARLKAIARNIPDDRLRWEVDQWIESRL